MLEYRDLESVSEGKDDGKVKATAKLHSPSQKITPTCIVGLCRGHG